jgi:hypothetical protein
LLGVKANDEYVEGSQLFLVSSGEKTALLVVGTRVRDGRACLVLGGFVTLKEDDQDSWKSCIPTLEKSAVYWLDPMESVQSFVNLPRNQDHSQMLAVGTSSRVLLLSTELKVLAQTTTQLSCSLAPLGSHTVAYCSRDHKLRYLCCLTGKFTSGLEDGKQQKTMDPADIVPDVKSTEALDYIKACTLCLSAYLEGLVEHRTDTANSDDRKLYSVIDVAFEGAQLLHGILLSLHSCGANDIQVQKISHLFVKRRGCNALSIAKPWFPCSCPFSGQNVGWKLHKRLMSNVSFK